jgi:TonB family protein
METFMASMLERLLMASVQAALLVAVVWLLCRSLPRLAPATQCWLWWLVALQVLAGLCMDPVQLRWLPAPEASATIVMSVAEPELPVAVADTVQYAAGSAWSWQATVLVLWMAGLVVMGWSMLRDARRTLALLRACAECTDAHLLQAVAAAASARGLRRTPRLRISDRIDSPLVLGHFRPALLLPANSTLDSEELEMAVAHELEHLRRADLWWGFIPVLARHCFFFHPLVHLAVREYGIAREAACDAAVVAAEDRCRRHYGELLLRLGTAPAAGTGLAAASTTFRALSRRLTLLQHTSFLPRAGSIAVMLLALAFVLPLRLVAGVTKPALVSSNPVVANAALPVAPVEPVVARAVVPAAQEKPIRTQRQPGLVRVAAPVPQAMQPAGAVPAQPIAPTAGQKARVIFRPDTRDFYPAASSAAGEEGTPKVRICIDAAGSIIDVTPAESSRFPRLDEAALRYAARMRFGAAVINGIPQGQCFLQSVKFSRQDQNQAQAQQLMGEPAVTPRNIPVGAPAAPVLPSAATGTVQKARVLYRPDPRDFYPAVARAAGEEGTPKVRVCVDVAGKVADVTVAESSRFPLLDEAARQYAARMRFSPGTVDGLPQAQCFLQSVMFSARAQVQAPQYTGTRMTATFENAPIRTLLQQISGISGKTIVVDESVSGSVTMRVDDKPWDQVLNTVLNAQGLEQRVQGNEIVITTAGAVLPTVTVR